MTDLWHVSEDPTIVQRFVQEGVAWAHLDIAGMAWSSKGDSTTPKGATAYGVRLLDTWIADNYEK